MEILKHADIDLEGKNAVVIGRNHCRSTRI